MINKISLKLVLPVMLPMALLFTSVSALANTTPALNYTGEKVIEQVIIDSSISYFDAFVTADVNGDGNLDILTLSDDIVSWYENGSDWEKTVIISDEGRVVENLAVGDLDGDGDVDIITTASNFKAVYLYKNGYDWESELIIDDIYNLKTLNLADMDGDGDLDIVVTAEVSDDDPYTYEYYNVIIWYENGNQWTENIIESDGYEPLDVLLADMDNDGDLDLVHSTDYFSNGVYWYENGNAWSKHIVTSSVQDKQIIALDTGDIDNDGDLDVILGLVDGVYWFENGNAWAKSPIAIDLDSLASLAVGDINGDNKADVFGAHYLYGNSSNTGAISLYESSDWSETVVANRNGIRGKDVIATDVDSDGDVDLLSVNYKTYYYSDLTLYKFTGYDSTIPVYVDVLEGTTDITLPLIGYDADGDALTYSVSGDDSAFFKVNQTGVVSFISAPDYHSFSDSNKDNVFELLLVVSDGKTSSSKEIKLEVKLGQDSDIDGITDAQELLDGTDLYDYDSKIDTDGDGVPDRLEIYYGGNINTPDALDSDNDGVIDYIERFYGEDDAPVWLVKTANGNHWEEKTIDSPDDTYSRSNHNAIAVADVTGDGVKDVLSDAYERITILNGANDFATSVVDADMKDVNFITSADLTNDGTYNPDIIITEEYSYSYSSTYNHIYWYEHGTWIKRPISTSGDVYGDLKLQDMDGDGDLDIIALTKTQIVWYENGNTWLKHSIIDIDFEVSRFEVVDFDYDGDIDIVATVEEENNIVWFENSTAWQTNLISDSIENAEGLAVKDIDDDGSLDIVVTSNDNSFTLLQNINGWQQTTLYSLYESDSTTDVVIADMNNDGLYDIIGSSSGSLVWFDAADDWSRVIINENTNKKRIIVADLTGDNNNDVIGSGTSELTINVNSNIATRYRFDVPDLSPEIKIPFVAFDIDGQNLSYSLDGDDAIHFNVDSDGNLSFASQLSIGTPVDFDGDNIFNFYIIASDGSNKSTVYLSLTLIESVDTDGDGILDSYDIDDDNDLVPDVVEIEEGTDPLDANSFLDEDRNGVPDFVQRSSALYINYQFPLGLTIDEGGFAAVDLSNVTSINGLVSIDVGEVQGLNYKFRDNVLYIYADYVSSNQTLNIDITLSDGVEVVKHVFPVYVINNPTDSLKIELIREAKAIDDGIRLQVAAKNTSTYLDFKWYVDGVLLTSENSQIFTLKEHHFKEENVVVKVEASEDGFISSYTDGIELNRTSFLAELAQAQTEQLEPELTTKNVAGSTGIFSLVSAISLLFLRRIRVNVVNPRKVFSKSKLILIILMMLGMTACSATTDTQHQLSPQLSTQTQTVNISLDESDPLYIAKQEYETEKEQAKLEKLRRKIESEVKERNERVHISTIGF
ncbi:hypothetical protein GCM10008107_09710 [Psychrosphaera saromensis]|uniref:Cadherin domain-containing protein n=1 Tax=Psychrosphaera saromensis TaxID=716813 RepID=A0A2S7UW58_9GAMM|nr:VCBS repeat-containing protein [Psychrosphaera saromensis]PQJ53742.1 hypothetical protein BTO11_08750 [Psychrosphaera saromensis]GHB62670.1 hypothetical protein GCM10008107_09710 [Psychrosphaera saromensis]GLQ15474.1 hypothetical protein GCM10007917_29290 [Psychrosphaera saromensis]